MAGVLRALIADDLTGAADAGAGFGRPVRLTIAPDPAWDPGLAESVLQVHDTESRHLTPSEAGDRVAAAHLRAPVGRLYQKVDSTLRGNPGAEIEGALRSGRHRLAVVAPAFPAHGRTVLGGVLRVDRVAVSQSAFGSDPRSPVLHDSVLDLLRATTDLEVVRATIEDLQRCRAAIAVVDAVTDDDLRRIAAAITDDMLPVGSAGLARALGEMARPGLAGDEPPPCHSVRVLVGSSHPVALCQAALVGGSDRVALRVNSNLTALTANLAADLGRRPLAVIATGGETALAVCRELGATALWPQGELEPGIPWSLLEGVEGVILVTKAGGFGPPTTLQVLVERLLGRPVDG